MAKNPLNLLAVAWVVMALVWLFNACTAQAGGHGYHGNQPGGSYRGGGDPYHYSDVQNPPQFTIYRDRRGTEYGSDPYHYSDVQDPPQFTSDRDRRR